MKDSNFFSLNWRDIAKGILMAVLTPAVVIVQQSLEAGVFTTDWKSLGLASLAGGVAYLVKNFFTKPDVQGIALPKPPRPPEE